MSLDKIVYDVGDSIDVNIYGMQYSGRASLVLQDKTQVYYNMAYNLDRNTIRASLPITNSILLNAGVLTLQLYTEDPSVADTTEPPTISDIPLLQNFDFNNIFLGRQIRLLPPEPTSEPTIDHEEDTFSGRVMQEIDIFVKPSQIIGVRFSLNQVNYMPGQRVSFKLDVDNSCPFCILSTNLVKAIVLMTDDSAFLEIEKANENPSLFTKVFLEKEIFTGKEFRNSSSYIDYLFNSAERNAVNDVVLKDNRLELLLGNQKFRKFFYYQTDLKIFMRTVMIRNLKNIEMRYLICYPQVVQLLFITRK